MAMNKKEKQLVDYLKIKCALKFTEKAEKDLKIPDDSSKIVNGYGFNSYSMEVCSSCVYHSSRQWDETTSQQPIRQFSTKLLALKVMRNEVELQSAEKLRKIDIMIDEEVEVIK